MFYFDYYQIKKCEHFRVTIVSNVFQNKTDIVDKYYGTHYSISKIPQETLNVIITF